LSEALSDPVYEFPERYKATSDWLDLWAFSEGKQLTAPVPPQWIQKEYADSLKPSQ
jgi:hypothetical protein